jgi:hypothetical protein
MSVDILKLIDMEKSPRRRLLRRPKELRVGFCDRCSQVCDGDGRSDSLRDVARERALRYGARLV